MSPEVIKGNCPNCGTGTRAFVRCRHTVDHPDDGDGTSASDTGLILECCGCAIVYFRQDFWFSEWDEVVDHPITGEPSMHRGIRHTYWPPPAVRKRPAWLERVQKRDTKLAELLNEMYSALDGDLRVLAAIGVRTAFDRATELLGVDPAISFGEKLRCLVDDGRVSGDEKRTLAVLVDASGAAAHRSWRPSRDQLATMLDAIESFLHRALVVNDGIGKLEASFPAKPKRRRAGKQP
jgi:hypothetical protein